MDYKIRGFVNKAGMITVEYTDLSPEMHSIPVPVDTNGLYVIGEALDSYIRNYFSEDEKRRVLAVKAGVSNSSEIELLVEPITGGIGIPPWSLNTVTNLPEMVYTGGIEVVAEVDWKVEVKALIQEVIYELANNGGTTE